MVTGGESPLCTRPAGAARSGGIRAGLLSVLAASAFTAGLGGCLDTGLLADVAFAPRIAGLPPGQPWLPLPVGSWVTESGIEPAAIVACLEPACDIRAVVARFKARGGEAATLLRIVDDPERLARELAAPLRSASPGVGARRAASAPADRRAVVSVVRLPEGPARGFVVRMTRPDGSRPAYGVVLSSGGPAAITILMVVAASEAAALRLAREVGAGDG